MNKQVILSIAVLGTFAGQSAHARGVDAGVQIANVAQAEYQASGQTFAVSSNTVTLRVNELLDVGLTSLQSAPQLVVGANATVPFEVTNTGNGPEAFRLTVTTGVPGNDFDASVESLAIDRNGNGLFDPTVDEIIAAPEATDVLLSDGTTTILVNLIVPTGLADGQLSQIELLASAVTGTGTPGTVYAGSGEGGVDAVVGVTTATATARGQLQVSALAVSLVKSASVVDQFGGALPLPGASLTYTIVAQVSGTGTAQGLVVTDAIPAGTTYVPNSLRLDAAPQTDAADSDAGSVGAAGIRVDLGDVAAGSTHAVSFDVSID